MVFSGERSQRWGPKLAGALPAKNERTPLMGPPNAGGIG